MRIAVSRYSSVSGVFAPPFTSNILGVTARKNRDTNLLVCARSLSLCPLKMRSVAISIDVKSKVIEHMV